MRLVPARVLAIDDIGQSGAVAEHLLRASSQSPADRVFSAAGHGIARLRGDRWVMGSPAGGVEVPARRIEARLLVVEDDPTILELLSGSLRFAG